MTRFRAALAYLWSLPQGRFAMAAVAVGVIGLTTHLWLPVLALVALPGRRDFTPPPEA